MDFLNVSAFSTSASTTKVLVLDGNTVKSRTAAQIIGDGGVAATVGRVILATAEDGWTMTSVAVSNPGTAIPVSDVRRYVIGFKPTGWRLSFRQTTTGDNDVGIRAQFSTSSTSWGSAVNTDVVYANYTTDNPPDLIRTGTGTISLSSSAPYFVRFLMFNDSGISQSLSIQDLTLELWN